MMVSEYPGFCLGEECGYRVSAPMTIDGVRECVETIAKVCDDDEVAHNLEDALYEAVLREFASGHDGAVPDLAREALKTKDIDFARWCA
jgi:hypothetical protein